MENRERKNNGRDNSQEHPEKKLHDIETYIKLHITFSYSY